jgi:hypothetical protein
LAARDRGEDITGLRPMERYRDRGEREHVRCDCK